MTVVRGSVLLLDLNPTRGHEQQGLRPCIVVSDPEVSAGQRFPLIAVVPLTRTPGVGALYPRMSPGKSGLTSPSFALIDHLRSVDKRRVQRAYGSVSGEELEAIDLGLSLFLGLASQPEHADANPDDLG